MGESGRNKEKGILMREASGKKSIVVWKVEVGKGRLQKRHPKVLKQTVKRNPDRFLPYFVFQLTIKETRALKSSGSRQTVTLNWFWQAKLDFYDNSL